MRFFPDGPSIPDTLLHRRDQGRVVFMCGAGISLHAGMPSFLELTRYVIDYFDPPESSSITVALRSHLDGEKNEPDRPKTPLDQIFQLLYQEYGREEVNALVAKRLSIESVEDNHCSQHAIITRLSTGTDGKPQIVTTNFDKLFEHVDSEQNITVHEPPAFPNLELGIPLSGVTYLHGRIKTTDSNLHPYILSSADFGRAYLSEGWATKFIRALLRNYTVVLIGYQAEDAPIKYLLQGLNHNGLSEYTNLYAFDRGKPEAIEAKWRDRGVTAIACSDYEVLWKSLEGWALRADDPRQWRADVVNMSVNGPRNLCAHERGQVSHVVRTTSGARLFAKNEPSPNPEWLCVFDSYCRLGKESRDYSHDSSETFDPFEAYALDDDIPVSSGINSQSAWLGDDIFDWRPGDTKPTDCHNLTMRKYVGFEEIPARLGHLAIWIAKHIDKPITAWWVARQGRLHPRLLNYIRSALRQSTTLSSKAFRIWNLILEFQSDERNFKQIDGNYEIRARLQNEGWTLSVVREFEEITRPIVSIQRPLGIRSSQPPLGDWDTTGLTDIARWEVKFLHQDIENIEVPDDLLESVYRISERHFRLATGLLEELGDVYFYLPTCYPTREVSGTLFDNDHIFNWLLNNFIHLISVKPEIAKGHVITWKNEANILFRKLYLFALNQTALFNTSEVISALMELPQKSFWAIELRRELLFLIHDRWDCFYDEDISLLTTRLVDGPDKMANWTDEEYPTRRKEFSCRYLGWLRLQGKEIPQRIKSQLDEMISEIPEWDDRWTSNFVTEYHGSLRTITADESPSAIINLPISKIIEYAKREYEEDLRGVKNRSSFNGLVKANPYKALASLSLSAKKNEYPQIFWSALIENWPENVSRRLSVLLIHKIKQLPHDVVRELKHPLSRWIQINLKIALEINRDLTWSMFDHCISALLSENESTKLSSRIKEDNAKEQFKRPRRAVEHAMSSPIGMMTEGLLNALDALKLQQENKIPNGIKVRLEQLYLSSGERGIHAVAIIARQIHWLNYIDSNWVRETVIPWFNFEQELSEPAWNGYLSANRLPGQEIGVSLKPLFLKLFPRIYQWNWPQHFAAIASHMLIDLALFKPNQPEGIGGKEIRDCIRNMNEVSRQAAIARLTKIGEQEENGWLEYVVPFISNSWPKEREYITSSTVLTWVRLLERSYSKFPELLRVVKRFLAPVVSNSYWLYSFGRKFKGETSLAQKYPSEVLMLLDQTIPNNVNDLPIGLAQILQLITDAKPELTGNLQYMRLIDLVEQT